MSWDVELTDPATRNVIQLPFKHLMIGGTYAAEMDADTGRLVPKPISEAELNITYNYSPFYKDLLPDDSVRGLDGMTGAKSISVLENAILGMRERHGEACEATVSDYWMPCASNAIKPLYQLKTMAELRPDGVWRVY